MVIGIFPLIIEDVYVKRCNGFDDDYESTSNSVAQITFEIPTFSDPASSSIIVFSNQLLVRLLVSAEGII